MGIKFHEPLYHSILELTFSRRVFLSSLGARKILVLQELARVEFFPLCCLVVSFTCREVKSHL